MEPGFDDEEAVDLWYEEEEGCETGCEGGEEGGDSPIVFDLDNNGFHFSGADDRVWFDINGDGVKELINWIERGSGDVFLAMDRNGNGIIDGGQELFGNSTPVYFGGAGVTATDGYRALGFLESPLNGSTDGDNVITAADSGFNRLLLWHDANHNGISEPEELSNAAARGLKSISLDTVESRRRDPHGNELRLASKTEWLVNGNTRHIHAVDVWFQYDR
jgi:hypothetical protein